jgi:DNA-binding NarL/FixJ family response regulator
VAGTSDPVRVLTVDDQRTFRRVAGALIDATPGFEHVGEAASGPQAISMTIELRPDLALVDVRMPGMDGIETAQRLTAGDTGPVVVLMSLEDLRELACDAASCGAAAYVRKQDLCPRVLQEVWHAHSGAAQREL